MSQSAFLHRSNQTFLISRRIMTDSYKKQSSKTEPFLFYWKLLQYLLTKWVWPQCWHKGRQNYHLQCLKPTSHYLFKWSFGQNHFNQKLGLKNHLWKCVFGSLLLVLWPPLCLSTGMHEMPEAGRAATTCPAENTAGINKKIYCMKRRSWGGWGNAAMAAKI